MGSSGISPRSEAAPPPAAALPNQTPPSAYLAQDVFATLLSRITLAEGPHDEIAVRSPWTGALLGHTPAAREADVALAVSRARAAQPAWAARSFAERAKIFLRFHDLLLQRQDEVLDIIQLETGMARGHAFEEILDTAIVSRYYARRAGKLLRPRRRKGALPLLTLTWELRAPVGVVGFIVPWNYPLNLAITDAVPALMAGNTAVLKPDRQTPFTALWAVDLLREAGLPPDVFPVVTGDGATIGPALGDRVDYFMFTGSTRTGKLIARQAADRLIGCSLELGGKNPMIVLRDADLERTVDGAIRGCFVAAGQACISIERIYVHESLAERFLSLFVERVRRLKMGAALDYSMEIGSLASERQLATVEEHVRGALEKGATLLAGGRPRPDLGPLFFEPTVLTNVRPDMKVYAEETFGPVVSVYPFATEAEAIERANATRYGLNASVWTRNTGKGVRLARKIRAGSVNINEAYAATWGSVDSPSGGMKESGLRARHGAEGILKFTESQTVAVQRLIPIAPFHDMSAAFYARWMTRLMKILRRIRVLG
ncbi:MAG: succinate-semialdehyde dehydrogenase (NADP(+)) [Acidobacteriia bacterium]|nr:succinate-semialdehyde dehydrogenase (NADP(+)) [Terriglobia bacterium]